ncbi:unnamed protein product [Hymenolepis diminuta]|uniref:Uncharacterized protein n=1 Tax=Hymenolepis diminuta TaxID=6216 RepID=A0A564YPM2_HYMDI|nr:unnamed protein product [Hymenolepis diminuta]
MKVKGQPVMLRPVLRSKVTSVENGGKFPEKFVELVLLFSLSALVHHKVDNNKLKVV